MYKYGILFDFYEAVTQYLWISIAFFDEKLCTEYLIAKDIIPHKARCPKCRQFTLKIKKDIKNYECRNVSCRKSLCIRKNTFFQDKNLKLGQILLLGLLWLNKIGVKAAISLTGHSSKTIVNYFKDFRSIYIFGEDYIRKIYGIIFLIV